MSRQTTDRENLFAEHISAKCLYPEYIINKLINEKIIQFLKWTKYLDRYFTKDDMQVARST